MIDVKKFGKLGVGDIAKYEQWQKDTRKRELIATMKELHGENIPVDSFDKIEKELRNMPSLLHDGDLDAMGIQYLLWLSLKKNDPDITLEQVGDEFDIEKSQEYIEHIFPPTMPEKKTPRKRQPVKKKAKKKKKNR